MSVTDMLEALGYSDSPNYVTSRGDVLGGLPDYAHIFRKAVPRCRLHGVYGLRPRAPAADRTFVPVVAVWEADSEADARRLHRVVWNQNAVPFLLVSTPECVRYYPGFRSPSAASADGGPDPVDGVRGRMIEFGHLAEALPGLRAQSIDDASVWEEQARDFTQATRVDRELLDSLEKLGKRLRRRGVDRETSHALIGKYVFLSYLRDRKILSPRKLARWGIKPDHVFSRRATLRSFGTLIDKLQEWLNGSIFPLESGRFSAQDLKLVAGVFYGDDPHGQLHLPFQRYDFSHIPIETLSVVYQQFLHATDEEGEEARGRELGAYYTPMPLVSFMLAELDDSHPLREGMKILDPSCGSGAFLVQCYRRLVEPRLRAEGTTTLPPEELRDLLVRHVYGVDTDGDACRVAELSLILALLDYVDPPDLEDDEKRDFQFPELRSTNIFESDFFAPTPRWAAVAAETTFDWVVGNPPWVELKDAEDPADDPPELKWIKENSGESRCPVGNRQLAEAFAWKVTELAAPGGGVALLLPAASLFNDTSEPFRRQFFRRTQVRCVVNFANLRHVLFAGRAHAPAAAFFYSPGANGQANERILTYAPFVANQEANLPRAGAKREATWTIIVNASEVRSVPASQAATGDMLPWKTAMWGSHRDLHLRTKLGRRFPKLTEFVGDRHLAPGQGFPPRGKVLEGDEKTVFEKDLVGKLRLDVKKLRLRGQIFAFPDEALSPIPRKEAYRRIRSGTKGLAISRPPHIIIDAAGRFAVYSDQFIAFSQPSLGIAGTHADASLLRALALYLSSDFVRYHQFLRSPEWGIRTTRATKSALDTLPVPIAELSSRDLAGWSDLHSSLVAASLAAQRAQDDMPLFSGMRGTGKLAALIEHMNAQVYKLLGLQDCEIALVTDLVHVRMKLNDGAVEEGVLAPPPDEQVRLYLATLKVELDEFVGPEDGVEHEATAVKGEACAMVRIEVCGKGEASRIPAVLAADDPAASELERARQRLRRRHSQWVYFDRNLRIYEGTCTYLLKPLQRICWTQSQALLDADEIIADTAAGME